MFMTGPGLSEIELAFVDELLSLGILEKVEGHRLPLQNGVISVFCSDCDRSPDVYEHLRTITQTQCSHTRIHAIADNGGPLLIPKSSPANKPGRTRDVDLLESIEFAMRQKHIQTIGLIGHAPCSIALDRKIDLFRTFALTLCAKTRIKTDLKRYDPKVACFYQIDFGERAPSPEKRLRTYFMNRTRFFDRFRTNSIYSSERCR